MAAMASLSSMFQYWKTFDLLSIQKDLDATATDLASRQDASDASRRQLVDQSREFKKSTPEDVRKSVAPLLKSFQNEVDALSKRSKAAEAAFLNIYKKLIDMPDPVSAIETSVTMQSKLVRTQDCEMENRKLRETLDEYNKEFADVRNQDVSIKILREKLRETEEKQDETIQNRLKEEERELRKTYYEKERQLQDMQIKSATKLSEAEQKVATMQAALESVQSELFDVKSKYEEEQTAKAAEIDMLITDLDRGNQKVATYEKQLETLTSQLTSANQSLQLATEIQRAPNVEQAIDVLTRSSLEVELNAKEKEITHLVEDVQHLQATVQNLKEASTEQIAKLDSELAIKNQALVTLDEKMLSQEDYEEIRRELTVLKSIEFSATEETSLKANKTLETLLLEKNRSLQSENTGLKVQNSEMSEKLAQLQEQHSAAMEALREQKNLIVDLEKDLLNVNSSVFMSSALRGQGEGCEISQTPAMSTELVAQAVRDKTQQQVGTSPELSGPESLLAIVSSQRERFRIRNQDLEAESCHQQQTINMLHNEIDRFRSDNLKLYEKIRFLQSYPKESTAVKVDDGGTESRYSTQYEAKLDPFTTFGKREKQRKYMSLSPFERVTLNLGQFVLSNKMARTITFFYTLLLHILVFLVLYKVAHTESCIREVASDCSARFAEHMKDVHGEADLN